MNPYIIIGNGGCIDDERKNDRSKMQSPDDGAAGFDKKGCGAWSLGHLLLETEAREWRTPGPPTLCVPSLAVSGEEPSPYPIGYPLSEATTPGKLHRWLNTTSEQLDGWDSSGHLLPQGSPTERQLFFGVGSKEEENSQFFSGLGTDNHQLSSNKKESLLLLHTNKATEEGLPQRAGEADANNFNNTQNKKKKMGSSISLKEQTNKGLEGGYSSSSRLAAALDEQCRVSTCSVPFNCKKKEAKSLSPLASSSIATVDEENKENRSRSSNAAGRYVGDNNYHPRQIKIATPDDGWRKAAIFLDWP
uniref:Uncharacterized protein n=1 Tax=Heterosigma akashiwo TaxID=2829 RepID=A0A6V1S3Q9_HETAK